MTTVALYTRGAIPIGLNAVKVVATTSCRPVSTPYLHHYGTLPSSRRGFASAASLRMKEIFPLEETKQIRKTEAAWAHPIYNKGELEAVTVNHREPRTYSDRVALFAVRVLRWGMDLATGYKHDKAAELAKTDLALAEQKYGMTERKYLVRNIFLESVAGVPGMVAGMLRHLRSMRLMRRDNGWIETLLEESYNERMHLLIFLKMAEPGWFMRLMVLGAQGVFFNGFFISYLISPRICHRFVGYLEEEACITYTREIEDIDRGRLKKWEKLQAPQIAIDYYHMPEGARTMRDMLLHIRADEAGHRSVNHTFANLDQQNDPNPFVSTYKDASNAPRKEKAYSKPAGWEREECI